jgi:hypothetical protein
MGSGRHSTFCVKFIIDLLSSPLSHHAFIMLADSSFGFSSRNVIHKPNLKQDSAALNSKQDGLYKKTQNEKSHPDGRPF